MKRKKSIFKLLAIILLLGVITTGCFKRDDMEDISIITTVYPLEYVVNQLYGNNSVVNSIYPDGVDIDEYKITSKEYKYFSKKDLFVYNGLSSDKDIALKLVNKNKNIMIMDANFGMEIQYGIEELWLNPSNLLMISQNIKNSLDELIDSKYIKEEIEKAYVNLKVELSELDADIKMLSENASNKTLVVASPSLQYLTKYGKGLTEIDVPDYFYGINSSTFKDSKAKIIHIPASVESIQVNTFAGLSNVTIYVDKTEDEFKSMYTSDKGANNSFIFKSTT